MGSLAEAETDRIVRLLIDAARRVPPAAFLAPMTGQANPGSTRGS